MQVATLEAGFSAGEADQMRRAIADWKRKDRLDPYYGQLVSGMLVRDYDRMDFGYATGECASELIGATLGDIRHDEQGDHRLHALGNGGKLDKVALPSLVRTALDQYLAQRGLPVIERPATRLTYSPGTGLSFTAKPDQLLCRR